MNSHNTDQWVLIKLAGEIYGLSIDYVREMTQMGRINTIPHTPSYVMGTMRLRERVLPIFDLRQRLGMQSLDEEKRQLVDLLTAREEDHVRWLAELEASVEEQREFTLAADPHKCAFGKWYDQFETDDLLLSSQMAKFDQPHKAIHAVAAEVLKHGKEGRTDRAREVIEQTRKGVLAEMVNLFEATRKLITERSNQIVTVMEYGGRLYGLVVDEILNVGRIDASQAQAPPAEGMTGDEAFITGVVASDLAEGRLVLLLDAAALAGAEAGLLEAVQ